MKKVSPVQLVSTLFQCFRCGHQWFSRVLKPKACPACKVYQYGERPKKKGKAKNG